VSEYVSEFQILQITLGRGNFISCDISVFA
jgi:hypothetical protein